MNKSFSEFIRPATKQAFSSGDGHGGNRDPGSKPSTDGIHFSINDINGAVSPFSKSPPSGFLSGLVNGISDLAVGVIGGATILVSIPTLAAIFGQKQFGAGGSLLGVTIGSFISIPCSYCLFVGGVGSCMYQILHGLIRSPFSIHASCYGYLWNELTEEWSPSNLVSDEHKYLGIPSRKDFLEKLSKSSLYQIRSLLKGVVDSGSDHNSNKEAADKQTGTKKDKNNEESSKNKKASDSSNKYGLYDVLGVDRDATAREIKRAYRAKALQYHPDRCAGQSPADIKVAQARFQQIGQAYSVLSDDHLRAVYDNSNNSKNNNCNHQQGEEVIPRSFDTSVVYAHMFGSSLFEDYIGELQLSALVKSTLQGDVSHFLGSVKASIFLQQQREIQASVHLASRLKKYLLMKNDQEIQEVMVEQLEALGESPLGSLVLSVIGDNYAKAAAATSEFSSSSSFMKRYMDIVFAYATGTVQRLHEYYQGSMELIATVSSGYELFVFRQQLHLKYKDGESSDSNSSNNNSSSNPILFIPGNDATETERAELCNKMNCFLANMIHVLWRVVKEDITTTLDSVCTRVLRDVSVSHEVRSARRRLMVLLAQAHHTKGEPFVREGLGLDMFIKSMADNMR